MVDMESIPDIERRWAVYTGWELGKPAQSRVDRLEEQLIAPDPRRRLSHDPPHSQSGLTTHNTQHT